MIIRGSKFLILKKRNKYGNKKTTVDGIIFDSKCEAGLYNMVKTMERHGEIFDIELQPHVYLTKAKILYKPDIKVKCKTTLSGIWLEAKGHEGAVWRIKRRLWKYYGPGILRVYKCSNGTPYLHEEIIPAGE